MKLEAVMENLQRQQAARLALEEKLRQAETDKDLRSMMEQQAATFRHYQTEMRGALTAGVANSLCGATRPRVEVHRTEDDGDSSSEETEHAVKEDDMGDPEIINKEEDDDEDDVGLNQYQHRQSSLQGNRVSPHSAPMLLMARVPAAFAPNLRAESPSAHPQSQHHEWTYEEQFKQVRQHSPTERFTSRQSTSHQAHSRFWSIQRYQRA